MSLSNETKPTSTLIEVLKSIADVGRPVPVVVLADERLKRREQMSELACETAESFQHATEMLVDAVRNVAAELRMRANKATDIVVEPEFDEAKRNNIDLWRDTAAHFEMIAHAIVTVPKSGEELKQEFADMLKSMIDERAANMAQAYQGRVLPELPR